MIYQYQGWKMTNGTLSTPCINGPGVQVGRRKGKQMKLPALWLWSIDTCHCSVQNVLGKWPNLYAISILNSQRKKTTAQPESPFVLCSEPRCLTYVRKKERANYLQRSTGQWRHS